jgi:hypothetical protein
VGLITPTFKKQCVTKYCAEPRTWMGCYNGGNEASGSMKGGEFD